MSTTEQIFLQSDLQPEEAAQVIANALGCTIEHDGAEVYLGRTGFGGVADYLVGELSENYLAEPDSPPEDRTAGDAYPLMWDLYKKGTRDWVAQRRAARGLFDELVAKVGWPVLLAHYDQMAVADWSPEAGLREFPEGTSIADNRVTGTT